MLLYGVTLIPLVKELCAMDPALLASFYVNHAVSDGFAQWSAQLINLLLEQGGAQGYYL